MALEISTEDLARLRQAQPPRGGLVAAMAHGAELWLEPAAEHYLHNHIAAGGSKVKFLSGAAGTGKSHSLYWLLWRARELGYATACIDLAQEDWRLSDLPGLYKALVAQLDLEALLCGLCRRVARELNYGADEYDGSGPLLPLLLEREQLLREAAAQELRQAAARVFQNEDLSPALRRFIFTLVAHRTQGRSEELLPLYFAWLRGEKLDAAQRRGIQLHERLAKPTARVWLYSLVQLVRLAGHTGLVLAVDNLDVLAQRDPAGRRYRYPPTAVKDACELLRQLIDDADLLSYTCIVLAGRPEVLEDEKRGLRSYEALWMRLQSGLVPMAGFNPYADIVDLDALQAQAGAAEFAAGAAQRLREALQDAGLKPGYHSFEPTPGHTPLQAGIAEVAQLFAGGAQ